MKRNTLIVMLMFCAALVFAQNGVIKELTGTVELKQPGQTAYITAKSGDTVVKDTIVSTGFKSSALISIGSTVLTVRPLTRLSLAEISAAAGTETLNVTLQTGRVRVDVNPPVGTRAAMNVTSPMATASVRGTSFEFDTQSLTVLEGTVTYQGNQGGVMMVSAGTASEVKENGSVADPVETYVAELQPPPLAGSDSGYRHTVAMMGEFIIEFNLK